MIGIDTNVLVRYVVRDDEQQHAEAAAVLETLSEGAPGFVTQLTLAELYWVLARSYRYPEASCLQVVRRLLNTATLEFDDGEGAVRALALAEDGADFADALIQSAMELFGVGETVTFDRAASQRLGWRLLGAR